MEVVGERNNLMMELHSHYTLRRLQSKNMIGFFHLPEVCKYFIFIKCVPQQVSVIYEVLGQWYYGVVF